VNLDIRHSKLFSSEYIKLKPQKFYGEKEFSLVPTRLCLHTSAHFKLFNYREYKFRLVFINCYIIKTHLKTKI